MHPCVLMFDIVRGSACAPSLLNRRFCVTFVAMTACAQRRVASLLSAGLTQN